MFDPKYLQYLGNNNGIDVFNYNGLRINAMVSAESDGRYLYVGMGQNIPEQILRGILSWFGIDMRRYFEVRKFFDNSRFFVQKQAA